MAGEATDRRAGAGQSLSVTALANSQAIALGGVTLGGGAMVFRVFPRLPRIICMTDHTVTEGVIKAAGRSAGIVWQLELGTQVGAGGMTLCAGGSVTLVGVAVTGCAGKPRLR